MRPIERNQATQPHNAACEARPEDIREAQTALNTLADASALEVSGRLDPATARQIAAFQRELHLPETGCLDDVTLGALRRAAADHTAAAASGTTAVAPRGDDARPNTRVNIHFRTFAPFRDFGGGFDGDARSFSASPSASSRLRTRVEVDTRENSTRIHHTTSGTRHPHLGSDNAVGHGTAEMRVLREGVSMMTFNQVGANPLVPGSPDIDRRATVVLDESTPGHLRLQIRAEGDSFPHCEMSISDVTGQSIFLDGYATPIGEHGPLSLYGVDDTQLLARDVDVLVDGRGRFMGVVLPNGEPVTVEEWNRRVIAEERRTADATDAGRQWW